MVVHGESPPAPAVASTCPVNAKRASLMRHSRRPPSPQVTGVEWKNVQWLSTIPIAIVYRLFDVPGLIALRGVTASLVVRPCQWQCLQTLHKH